MSHTNDPRWAAVDDWVAERLHVEDDVLRDTLAASAAAGLPEIQVSAAQGRQLTLLAMSMGARRVLEIGTLGGYSTICLARGLAEGGEVVTLEFEPHHAAVARQNIERAGLADRVRVVEGAALETLPSVLAGPDGALAGAGGAFDLVFIDADKENAPAYFELVLPAVRPGGAIVVDNVVRRGELAVDPERRTVDARTVAMRELVERVGRERRVVATVVQTVGSKSYDGYLMAVRVS